jgi:hypothetical protein
MAQGLELGVNYYPTLSFGPSYLEPRLFFFIGTRIGTNILFILNHQNWNKNHFNSFFKTNTEGKNYPTFG